MEPVGHSYGQQRFNQVVLREHLESGQRIEHFAVDVWDWARWSAAGSGWNQVFEGTTVGAERIVRMPTATSDRLRLRILGARVAPTLAEVGLCMEPERLPAPLITRDRAGNVALSAPGAAGIAYTLDGSEPGDKSPRYDKPIPLPAGGVVRARAIPKEASPVPSHVGKAVFRLH